MYFNFLNKRICGVLSILPENEYRMEDEVVNPDDVKTRRLKRIIGYGLRRRVKGATVLSDLLLHGMNDLLQSKKICKDDIGAIVVSTLSQDYLLPSISTILQGELDLPQDVFCLDIPNACAGYVIGLIESFMLLEHMTDKKVVLCTGEIFNRKRDENEPKFEHPSFGGDIANITIIENSNFNDEIICSALNDGADRNALLIPNGAFKNPEFPFDGVRMDGSAVFNFMQKEVPPAVDDIIKRASRKVEDIDYFLFHQPNKFMLQKLATTLGVPYEKVPMNVTEILGNSDSGTIPAAITLNLAEKMKQNEYLCCLSGFGGGLTWASLVMKLGKMDFCGELTSNL